MPKHPIGPEIELRGLLIRLVDNYVTSLKTAALRHAQRRHTTRQDAQAWRLDGLRDIFKGIVGAGKTALSNAKRTIEGAASRTARSAMNQVAAITGKRITTEALKGSVDRMVGNVVDGATSILSAAADKAADVASTWAQAAGEDVSTLASALDDALGGMASRAAQSVSRTFAKGFGEMNQAAQEQAGERYYMWVTQQDDRVRKEHAALLWKQATFDDPPLTAANSDNGEDCNPGDDYNCRCIAVPLTLVAQVQGGDLTDE